MSDWLSWQPRRGFIKTQLVCQGRSFYCHWFVHYNVVVVLTVIVVASSELNAPALPGENGDAFCLFTSAEQHSENVSYYCLSNQCYISQSEREVEDLPLSGYTSGYPLQY